MGRAAVTVGATRSLKASGAFLRARANHRPHRHQAKAHRNASFLTSTLSIFPQRNHKIQRLMCFYGGRPRKAEVPQAWEVITWPWRRARGHGGWGGQGEDREVAERDLQQSQRPESRGTGEGAVARTPGRRQGQAWRDGEGNERQRRGAGEPAPGSGTVSAAHGSGGLGASTALLPPHRGPSPGPHAVKTDLALPSSTQPTYAHRPGSQLCATTRAITPPSPHPAPPPPAPMRLRQPPLRDNISAENPSQLRHSRPDITCGREGTVHTNTFEGARPCPLAGTEHLGADPASVGP